MVGTRSSRSGQPTFASLPTVYRTRRSTSQPKSQPTSSSPAPAQTSEAIANPGSNEKATSHTKPFSSARSSSIDGRDQVDDSYVVSGLFTQCAFFARHRIVLKCHDTCRIHHVGNYFPTTHISLDIKKTLTMRLKTGNTHETTEPDNNAVAKPDSLSPALSQSQTGQFQSASGDLQINIPTADTKDEVQGADQGRVTSGNHSMEGCSSSMDISLDDAKFTNNVSTHDAMEGVQGSEQESDPSGDSATTKDNSADDAGLINHSSTHDATEWPGAPEPHSDSPSGSNPAVNDGPANEVSSLTNAGPPDATDPNEASQHRDEPADPSMNVPLAKDSIADGMEFLNPSAYTDASIIDPAIEGPQQKRYEYVLGQMNSKSASRTVHMTPRPSPYPDIWAQRRSEVFTLHSGDIFRVMRRLPMNVRVPAMNVPATRSSRFDNIDGRSHQTQTPSSQRMVMYDPMMPSNLPYERGDPRRFAWRADFAGNPDYFID